MTNPRKGGCIVAAFLIALMPLALAQGTYTQIDVPGSTSTQCIGINTYGNISGLYLDTNGYHGFFLSAGNYTTIDYPGTSGSTYAYGLNDFDQVVGQTNSPPFVGFLYDVPTKTFTQISYPGASNTVPIAINNVGTVAGFTNVGESVWGFERAGSSYRRITPPGALYTYVTGISSGGKLVGDFTRSTNYVYFSYARGQYRKITIPNTPSAEVLGINPAGNALVGVYIPSPGFNAGFLYQNKTLQTLEFPGSNTTAAESMNTAGEVVGSFTDASNVGHGFIWTPPAHEATK